MVLINNNIFYSINYKSGKLIIIYPNKTKDVFINVPESVYYEFESSGWSYSFFKENIEYEFKVYENTPITFGDEIPKPKMPKTFDS
jgi:hypothetical protein